MEAVIVPPAACSYSLPTGALSEACFAGYLLFSRVLDAQDIQLQA